MATTRIIEEETAKEESPSNTTVVPEKAPSRTVADVVALIRRESREEPKRYLDEVHVPGGGE